MESSNFSQELCFIWGAPLSGQRRWMLRSAELSKPEIDVSLLFMEPDVNLQALTGAIEAEMQLLADKPPTRSRHIYVELPASLLHEDFELDAWLQKHPSWHATFAGLVSEDAHLLNAHYRTQYEEFSRSAQSAVILGRSQGLRDEMPLWVDRKMIDFGKRVEVYEDDLWPRALITGTEATPQGRGLGTLISYDEEYEELQLPLIFTDSQKMELLFRQMLQGDFGTLWGAEVLRPVGPATPQGTEIMGLSLVPHAIYEWRSKVRARCVGLSDQIAMLNVVGVGLEKHNIIQALRSLQLLVDS